MGVPNAHSARDNWFRRGDIDHGRYVVELGKWVAIRVVCVSAWYLNLILDSDFGNLNLFLRARQDDDGIPVAGEYVRRIIW